MAQDCTMKVWSVHESRCKQSVVHAGTVWQAPGAWRVWGGRARRWRCRAATS